MFQGSKKPLRKFVALQSDVFGGYTNITQSLTVFVTLLLTRSLSEGFTFLRGKHFSSA
jgi:hypothetical protein